MGGSLVEGTCVSPTPSTAFKHSNSGLSDTHAHACQGTHVHTGGIRIVFTLKEISVAKTKLKTTTTTTTALHHIYIYVLGTRSQALFKDSLSNIEGFFFFSI